LVERYETLLYNGDPLTVEKARRLDFMRAKFDGLDTRRWSELLPPQG
jgi:hypothetical protein